MSQPALLVRPAQPKDVPDLLDVASHAGAGMTTVPVTEDGMGARIDASIAAFSGSGRAAASEIFTFVLDDGEKAVGLSSIFPDIGADRPFYSYRISHVAAQSPESNLRSSTDVLHLVNDFHGADEVASLLLGNTTRGQGAGRLISLCRFMMMGSRRERFGDRTMAEIRGWFSEKGISPFWEHIGAKFFHTSFEEADRLSAYDFRFISHLMPKYPIYLSLLPVEAQAVIAKPHMTSSRALNMLEAENFRQSGCIDIFDGGPSIECLIDDVRTIQEMKERRLTISASADHLHGAEPLLVSTSAPDPFACAIGYGHRQGQSVVLTPDISDRGGFVNGSTVLVSPIRRNA